MQAFTPLADVYLKSHTSSEEGRALLQTYKHCNWNHAAVEDSSTVNNTAGFFGNEGVRVCSALETKASDTDTEGNITLTNIRALSTTLWREGKMFFTCDCTFYTHNIFYYIELNSKVKPPSNHLPPVTNKLHSTFRSFNNSAMSICGLLSVPVLLEHSALCRLLAPWFRDWRMWAAPCVSLSPREHRRISLISSSIFLERMLGNTALTRSNVLFLMAGLRHARFSMNTPGQIVDGDRQRRKVYKTKTKTIWKH